MFLLNGTLVNGLLNPNYYLDPGSGSFLLQLLIAAIAGLSIAFAAQWGKVKNWFKKKNSSAKNIEDEDENEEDE